MSKKLYLLSILIGTILFVLDAWFGWLSMVLGGFPGVLVIAVIVGLIATNWKDGIVSMLAVIIIGVLVAGILAPYVFSDWGSSLSYDPLANVFTMIFYPFANGHSLIVYHQPYYLIWDNVELIIHDMYLGGLIILAPVFYVTSFILAAIGGIIGKQLRPYFERRFSASSRATGNVPSVPSESPDSQDSVSQ